MSPTEGDSARQAYYEYATTVAAAGGATLVPYETAAAESTQYALDLTQYVESFLTPTPFGPLPFPGTRLTDEELAERGWPRILESGERNEDYHTTAIWLDKAYVDAEIFSQYQALFELLAFREGPPGEDFEAKLSELMITDGPDSDLLDDVVQSDINNRALADCDYQGLLNNVNSLRQSGGYVSFGPDGYGRTLGWEWGNRTPVLEVYSDRAIGYQVGQSVFVMLDTVLINANGTVNSLSVDFETRAVFDGRVLETWYANWDPTRSDSNAMMVWQDDGLGWRALKFGSPYCIGYYPGTIRK